MLTGPALLSYAEVAQKVALATGKAFRFVDVPEALWEQQMLDADAPAALVASFLAYFSGGKAGRMYLNSAASDVLRHPPRSFAQRIMPVCCNSASLGM